MVTGYTETCVVLTTAIWSLDTLRPVSSWPQLYGYWVHWDLCRPDHSYMVTGYTEAKIAMATAKWSLDTPRTVSWPQLNGHWIHGSLSRPEHSYMVIGYTDNYQGGNHDQLITDMIRPCQCTQTPRILQDRGHYLTCLSISQISQPQKCYME